MRKLIIAASVVLAVLAGGAFYLFSSLDGIVKTVIERVGTEAAGAKVSVGTVHLRLSDGRATIGGLAVANPPGFSATPAVRLGEIMVAIDTQSLKGGPIVLREVLVSAPDVSVETSTGGSNLDVLRRALDTSAAGPVPSEAAHSAATPIPEKKVVIDHLRIREGKVAVKTGGDAAVVLPLGDIEIDGIGRATDGASGVEIGRVVLGALIESSVRAALETAASAAGADFPKAVGPTLADSALKGGAGKEASSSK